MRQLYAYQKEMVHYLKENKQAALYAEMRLGKSLCTIRALKDVPGRKLIICPKSVISTWCDELEMEGIKDYLWFSSEFLKRYKNPIYLPTFCIINYEAATRLTETWLPRFHQIVIDESVTIKSPKAKITKFLLNNFENAERKILLSGNPAPNTPLEYFTQMQFLYGEFMGCKNYWQFRRRYFTSDLMGWQWWTRHSSKEAIKIELHKKCYFLSRQDVGVENKKVYEKREVTMPPALAREYKRMEREFVASLPEGGELETNSVLAQLSFLQQMAGGALKGQAFSDFKVKELISLLTGELAGEKVLVWCQFRWEIEAIRIVLIENKLNFEVIHGDVKIQSRKEFQDAFNNNKLDILVLQSQTSRYGLNLAGGDTAIYYSNGFSFDSREQSEARIQSNSKKFPLLYIDLVTKDSVDGEIFKALQTKQKNVEFFRQVIKEVKERYA